MISEVKNFFIADWYETVFSGACYLNIRLLTQFASIIVQPVLDAVKVLCAHPVTHFLPLHIC